MSISTIIIGAVFLVLQTVRTAFFHTNNFAIHDPIFSCRLWDDTPRVYLKILLCNLCFLAVCACAAFSARLLFSCSDEEILWGVAFGTFCMVWPVIYTYRLYAFWKNPAALICLFHNILEIGYAVWMTAFFLTGKAWYLFSLLIPVVCIFLRRRLHNGDTTIAEDMSFQTKLFCTWKKVKLREPAFLKKYGTFFEQAAAEYRLPMLFLERFVLLEQFNHGAWYYRVEKWLLYHLLPFPSIRNRISLGLGLVKPVTAAPYYGGIPKDIYARLNDPAENIRVTAWLIRNIIDAYPGAGCHLTDVFFDPPLDAVEYDALDEVGQLCRYVIGEYLAGLPGSRMDYASIFMDVLLKSGAEKLLEE